MTQKFRIVKGLLTKIHPYYRDRASSCPPISITIAPHSPSSEKQKTGVTATPAPQLNTFVQLKLEENRQFHNKKRRRSSYEDNCSAALAFDNVSKGQELQEKHDDPEALITMFKDNVVEHANRRVDLFFYTLIAYYKTYFSPINGHTNLQHGRGRHTSDDINITEACHSSFTPSLLDETIFQTKKRPRYKSKSLLDGTHLMDSLNSTVELPPIVNDFDDVLESMCRQKCLDILCAVSLGTINPIEGLNMFLDMMKNTLTELKQQEQRKRSPLVQHSLISQNKISLTLIDLVITGTLATTCSHQTQNASDDYIQLSLRLKPEEKILCSRDDKSKHKIYESKIKEIQKEILETRSSLSQHAL
jgi:hypothetical protein